ncbi:DUF2339 domain-containing protein [Horticoccus sp. 23ND18S-11]|uniref:hypothetical protein n=1 Tax=Horticoccus sp. 23ND18S-11 TaxID=3391832 RepID=UPI0039C9F495
MTSRSHEPRRRVLLAAAGLAVIAFALLAGRFWHPYYGFTKFVQLDAADARSGIPEIREHPVFAYDGFNGYDGAAYTQIAFHPLLDSPDLQPALGNVPYRARRILGSALAWVLAAGDPARIANTYAALNLAVWLVLAFLLWRVLPVRDARSWLAWAGVMFSAGALHSVRLALTDLLAATLVTAAIALDERGRSRGALGVLAMAGLARETALAGVVALWRGPWRAPRGWIANARRAAIVALPLGAWMIYVRWKAGPAAQGLGNFTWPVVGWIEKIGATLADFGRQPDFRWLNTTTLLALIALTAQAAFFLRRWHWNDAWWRAGASGVAMMALLGTSVWEGHPGAATRVLLPMSVAFAVLAVRVRASWIWIAAGGLSVCSGVLALWHVPNAPRELAAGRSDVGAYVVQLDTGWFGVERNDRTAWAWSGQNGRIAIEIAPRTLAPVRVRLKLRAIAPRDIEVLAGTQVVWRGPVGERVAWVEFEATPAARGRLELELRSSTPAVRENDHADARALGFALYGVEVK